MLAISFIIYFFLYTNLANHPTFYSDNDGKVYTVPVERIAAIRHSR